MDQRPVVLIVDDDEEIRETLRFALEDDGYEVIEAPDGAVALDVLHALPYPIVVLTNHNMPRLDGPGLLSFVREDPALAQRHAYIYMTAGNRLIPPTFARDLAELGVPVLRKPFDIEELLRMVADANGRLQPAGSR